MQFQQLGLELVASPHWLADVEAILLASLFLEKLNVLPHVEVCAISGEWGWRRARWARVGWAGRGSGSGGVGWGGGGGEWGGWWRAVNERPVLRT